jgi:hypothetical protein
MMVCLALALMAGVCPAVFAQQGHEPGDKAKTAVPATAGEILTAVDMQLADLDKTVAAKALDKVHVMAFTIRDLLLALPEKTGSLPAPGKTALAASLGKIKQQAGLLDKYGDAGDLAQTTAVLAKFKEEIAKIKQIPGLQP